MLSVELFDCWLGCQADQKRKAGPNFGVGLTKKHVLTIHQQDQRSKRLSLRTKSSRVSSSCAQLVPGLCQQCANNPFSCNTTKQATSGLKPKPSNKRAYFGDQCYVLGSLHFCNRIGYLLLPKNILPYHPKHTR